MKKSKFKITTKNIPDQGDSIRYKDPSSRCWKDAIFLGDEFVEGVGVMARLGKIETGENFFISLNQLRNPF